MKQSTQKKPSVKLTLDKKQLAQLGKVTTEPPPSSKQSQQTISSVGKSIKTSASSQQMTFKFNDSASTPNPSILTSDGNEFQTSILESHDSHKHLIQYLITENEQLQKQNSAKDSIIDHLLGSNIKKPYTIYRANTSNTERATETYKFTGRKVQNIQSPLPEKRQTIQAGIAQAVIKQARSDEPKTLSPLGFTFSNNNIPVETKSSQGIRTLTKRLPKEFQIVPSKKKYFI